VLVATILAHGAVITSIGLALATWVRRQSRAIGLSVALFVVVAVAWPMLALTLARGPGQPEHPRGVTLSPIYTVVTITSDLAWPDDGTRDVLLSATESAAGVAVLSLLILEATIRTFDRCMGRMPERRSMTPP
jgi:ABC-type transport system involved in multi-copper enzyme maturation permease subunit